MLFNSLQYALFLPLVVAIFWLSPQKYRVPVLLVASYLFYMSWRPVFIFLILGLTAINFFLGRAIATSTSRKKFWLTVGVALNLVTLGYFKYAYFFDDLARAILSPFGINVGQIPFDIVLPLAISFFVFEFIHYICDIYRGAEPIKSFLSFALFASFFPTQIAGPIKRFQDFIPQFLKPSKFSMEYIDQGVPLILLGLFKKVLIADNLAFFVQGGYSHPELFSGLDLWMFTYAFAFQIYFDFSGYTDVARGSAALFGYKVPINFNLPYLAGNISEFWHRWHISLSTWLRDYLFIPLGGSRGSRWQTARNLLLTMTLGGLWHGAAMHYVLWGIYHGAMLVFHRECKKLKETVSPLSTWFENPLGKAFSILLTFHVVCIGWVLFRAETASSAMAILSKMLTFADVASGKSMVAMLLPSINYPLIYSAIYLVLPLLAVAHVGMEWLDRSRLVERSPWALKAAWCFILMFLIMVFSPDKSPRFIYFQF
ncbi:MAG: MBOAT family protein [Cyanobacteria bacterium]|nr:MBOAT family protein [Cyanobacteriota bacterium]